MSLGKIAAGIAAVVVIAFAIGLMTGNMGGILNAVWDWVFQAMGATNPPAAPF